MCLARAWLSIWIRMDWGFQWGKKGEAASDTVVHGPIAVPMAELHLHRFQVGSGLLPGGPMRPQSQLSVSLMVVAVGLAACSDSSTAPSSDLPSIRTATRYQ